MQKEKELGIDFDLSPIFKPDSIAVVGVSRKSYLNPGSIIYLKNLFEMNLGKRTYAINPHGGELEGREVYTQVSKLPEVPDVAVIAVPPKIAIRSIKDCINFGVKGLIVISGGFAETGKEGLQIQNEIAALCYDSETPLIGPNCVGVYHHPYIDTIFLPTEKLVLPNGGNVSIVSQSGGVLLDQFFLSFKEREIGISSAISIGNKAVINEVHMLDYFMNDKETDVIAFYIEGFSNHEGREFLAASKKTQKDIVIYHGGISEKGKRAVESHTASLTSDAALAKGAFKQYGIIQPHTEEEVLNYIKTYSVLSQSRNPLDFSQLFPGRVAVVTVSGGHGVVCIDLLSKYNLVPVEFNDNEIEEMKRRVGSNVARIGAFKNPIDLTGATGDEDIVKILDYLFTLNKIDIILAIVVPYPPAITIQIGRRISLVARHHKKPLVCFVPYIEKYNLIRESLDLYHVPVAHTVSETVQMAAAIRDKSRAVLRLAENKLTKDMLEVYTDYLNM